MRTILAVWTLLALGFAPAVAQEDAIRKGSVVVLPLKGEVNEAQFFVLRRVLKQAEAAGAAAFVIDMDTYGGSLGASVKMLGALMKSDLPTITYVDSNAGSAGALIAISTKKIYMAPVSAIGAAAPVSGGGQDLQETMSDKVVSYFSGYFRSAAERNGYNPEITEAFINKEKEVKIGDTIISPKGTLLTLSAQEAVKVHDGRPLLASGIAENIDDLCVQAGLDPRAVVRVEPGGFERIALAVTALAPLFLLGGMAGAWIEFKTPGFGVAGILSILCFALFFAGHYIAGLTGFEAAAVFAVGVLLVLLEVLFFPGVVFLAALGVTLMLGSLFFAMVDFYPGEAFSFSAEALVRPAINLSVAVVLFGIFAALLARFLPDLPIFNRLVLAAQQPVGSSRPETPDAPVRVGDIGVARTILRPAGRAEFGDDIIDVVSDGEFLDPGSAIRVLDLRGGRVVVARA